MNKRLPHGRKSPHDRGQAVTTHGVGRASLEVTEGEHSGGLRKLEGQHGPSWSALLVATTANWLDLKRLGVVAVVVITSGCAAVCARKALGGRQLSAPDGGMNRLVRSDCTKRRSARRRTATAKAGCVVSKHVFYGAALLTRLADNRSGQPHLSPRLLVAENGPIHIGAQFLAGNASQRLNVWAVLGRDSGLGPLIDRPVVRDLVAPVSKLPS